MKKIFALGFLSIAVIGMAAVPASAWWPCFPLCCRSSKCCTSISLRQYNAFTPICCGNLSCDGCCPMSMTSCGGPALFGLGCNDPCANSCCSAGFDSCYGMGRLPAPSMNAYSPSGTPPHNYQAPMPAPVDGNRPQAAANGYTWPRPMPYGGPVQQTSYQQPSYNPGYAPMPAQANPNMYYNPNYYQNYYNAAPAASVPWYWNPGGVYAGSYPGR